MLGVFEPKVKLHVFPGAGFHWPDRLTTYSARKVEEPHAPPAAEVQTTAVAFLAHTKRGIVLHSVIWVVYFGVFPCQARSYDWFPEDR